MSSSVNKKQKLASSIKDKYVSAVFDHSNHDYVSCDGLLNNLQCYQTKDTLLHTFKTTGENFEFDVDIAVCYFPLTHAYAQQDRDRRYFIEFDLLFHRESVWKIMLLYGVQPQFEKIKETEHYTCLQGNHKNYIHYRDLIAYLYDYKISVDAIGTPLQQYEKFKQDGTKTTDGVQELMETLGLAESLTAVWRKQWQQVRPDQVDIYHWLSEKGNRIAHNHCLKNQNQIAQIEAAVLRKLPLDRLARRLDKKFTLQRHQQHGIRWMYLREQIQYFGVSGAILADEMGLGKTLQSLSLIVMEPNCCQLAESINLVVCKLSVLHQWQEETRKFFPGNDINVLIYYNGGNNATWDEIVESARKDDCITIVLTTYDQIRERYQKSKSTSVFINYKFHRIICDEGHQIANANSATARALASLKARHRWILSGSPYRNSPRDLFSLAVQFLKLQDSFLDEDRFGRKARWNRAFTRMDAIRDFEETGIVPKFNLSPYSIRDEARVESWLNVLMLRRMQSDHCSHLPERINHEHVCAFQQGSEELAIYEHVRSAVENFVLNIFESGESFSFTSVHGGVMLLRRICVSHDLLLKDEDDGRAMWNVQTKHERDEPIRHLTKHHVLQALPRALKSYLEDHRKDRTKLTSKCSLVKSCIDEIIGKTIQNRTSTHKIVVFSQWSGVLDLIEQLVSAYFASTFTILRIDGGTPGKARANQCASFNSEGSRSHILLLNYKAAGEGLNLQRGQHILLIDPWFTPSVEDQAIARVHRQGNINKEVHVHRFVIERSIEQRVQQISDRKRTESQRLLSMGLVHRARMVQNTIDLSKDAVLELLVGDNVD